MNVDLDRSQKNVETARKLFRESIRKDYNRLVRMDRFIAGFNGALWGLDINLAISNPEYFPPALVTGVGLAIITFFGFREARQTARDRRDFLSEQP